MTVVVVSAFTSSGVPVTGLSPTIRIRRTDTQALVVTDDPMVEAGDGAYTYDFTGAVAGVEYAVRADGGTTLDDADRYTFGAVSGTNEARMAELDPANLPADIDTLKGRTVDLGAALAFFGATLGTPVTHTPTTVTAGGFTWSVAVAGPNITFTRLT